jgi:hypothetical protein
MRYDVVITHLIGRNPTPPCGDRHCPMANREPLIGQEVIDLRKVVYSSRAIENPTPFPIVLMLKQVQYIAISTSSNRKGSPTTLSLSTQSEHLQKLLGN